MILLFSDWGHLKSSENKHYERKLHKMKKFLIFILLLVLVYFLGPSPDTPKYSPALTEVPLNADDLVNYVNDLNAAHKLKPGNEAKIVWNNPAEKTKTKVAVLYLHGFSASQMEGFPTHLKFAEKYGCNLYLARLSGHGIDTTDAMFELTADRLWNSAKEAYAIAKNLGDEIVIMSTSTGGTLAIKLAATYPEIKGLINFSPNLEINDPAAFLLNDPWGLQIARLTFNGDFRTVEADAEYKKYWYAKYRLESVVALEELVETIATTDTYQKVKCPVFSGVYYRDEENQDQVIRVSAVREMHREIATPEDQKLLVEFPTAGNHVIANDRQSGALTEVFEAISTFAEMQLAMTKEKKLETE